MLGFIKGLFRKNYVHMRIDKVCTALDGVIQKEGFLFEKTIGDMLLDNSYKNCSMVDINDNLERGCITINSSGFNTDLSLSLRVGTKEVGINVFTKKEINYHERVEMINAMLRILASVLINKDYNVVNSYVFCSFVMSVKGF